ISYCPSHGYMKSKIRIRKSENDKVYVVKTSKFISEEDCQKIIQRRDAAKEHRKMNKKKHKVKV
ncbi:MAG: DNA polymerase III, partial [Lachnospiraceae bacterium]|nr:DNA polymerase III [Lachnospiraceae bacterium]